MSNNCLLSDCTEVTAIHFRNALILRAKGTKPTPCHKVGINQLPIRIFPPEYGVETCEQPGICMDVIAPFDVINAFLAPQTETVKVHCADGIKVVPVQVVRRGDETGSVRLLNGEATGVMTKREAVGYSSAFDFREAFEDALKKLPADPNPFPDKLVVVRVVESGALLGGIAGFHKMFVRIEAS